MVMAQATLDGHTRCVSGRFCMPGFWQVWSCAGACVTVCHLFHSPHMHVRCVATIAAPESSVCNAAGHAPPPTRTRQCLTSPPVGGLFAFAKAGSTKSLTSAGGAALILALSARGMVGGAARGSVAVCLALSLLLTVVMAGRYSRTRKLMPAGLTAVVSICMSAAYLLAIVG